MDFFNTNLFNWYGLAFAIALLVPDIVYIKSNGIDRTIFDNRAMLYIERIGKYCSIFLMGINIGVLEGGFTKPIMETFWIISTCVLTVIALIILVFIDELIVMVKTIAGYDNKKKPQSIDEIIGRIQNENTEESADTADGTIDAEHE